MTWWERCFGIPAGVLLFLYALAILSVILGGAALIVFYAAPLYLIEHLSLEALWAAFVDALKLLATALMVSVGWFGGCWITERFSSRGWVIGLGGLVFVVLLHLPVWLISEQTQSPVAVPGMPESSDSRSPVQRGFEEFGANLFRSSLLAFLVYLAFLGGRLSATQRLDRRPTCTELNVRELLWLCVKVCAVVAGVAILFATWLGSGSYDEDGYMIDEGFEVASGERFVYGVSTFLFLVIPALLAVWWTLRQPLADPWRGVDMSEYRRVYDSLAILTESERKEFMANPEAKRPYMNKKEKGP